MLELLYATSAALTGLLVVALSLGGIVLGIIAETRGRSGFGWFLLGLFCRPLFLVLLLCLPPAATKVQLTSQYRPEADRFNQMMADLRK